MEETLSDHGIHLVLNTGVEALEGSGKVERVVTGSGTFDTDMVVLAIGFRPNNVLGKDHLILFKNGAYQVNRRQQTSSSRCLRHRRLRYRL